MQSIAHIAPAIAGLFFTQFVVSLTGVTASLAYLIGILIVLMLGSTLVQLSKHMSAAGGYYTFVSQAIHPRAGFLTAWMYVFYSPLCAGPIYAYFGFLLQQELKAQYAQVGVGRRLKPKKWPNGARIAVALSFDVDNATVPLSRGDLGSEVISHCLIQ